MLLDWGLGLDRDTSFSPAASRRQRLKMTNYPAARGTSWMAFQWCRKMDQPTSGFRSANHTKERPKNEFASSCFWRIPFFLAQNALPDNDMERPRNAKERLALKLCPLSGKTAFLGIALWKDRIFKRKNPRPRNARSRAQGPPPRCKPGTYCHASAIL